MNAKSTNKAIGSAALSILASGEKGSYWFNFSGSLTAWLYTCCRIWRRSPRDGCLFSLWAGSDVPFSFNKITTTTNFETEDTTLHVYIVYWLISD
jgi:hypothetical protein